jgi:hypothetical protein
MTAFSRTPIDDYSSASPRDASLFDECFTILHYDHSKNQALLACPRQLPVQLKPLSYLPTLMADIG